MRTAFVLSFIVCGLAATPSAAQSPNLDFFEDQVDGGTLREMLPAYLKDQVRLHRSPSPVAVQGFRTRFIEGLGGLPARTPLNPRVVGTLNRDGYRIEKVIFESQPGLFVTANLYLPISGRPPYPAILFPIGHEPGAKAYPVWQRILASFAKRGYVALTWDQIGQGERIQQWDESLRRSKAGQSTTEHTILGIQCLVTGDAFAKYTIWDGIRALDYLLSRPEVDPKRIGITGNSGGGTHTAYLAALDDRIHVAAPSCYITSWQRLLESIGPQDAEQCIPGFLGAGFEHVDFIRAFAPKPYLVLSAIRDFFSIQGARSTYSAASEIYTAAAARDHIGMAEADEGHGYTSDLRIASYTWFDRWLKNQSTAPPDDEIQPATPEDLNCTPSGQVATSLAGQTVFSLNRSRARSLNPKSAITPEALRKFIAWRENTTSPPVRPYGAGRQGELVIEKLVYESEPGILIPAVIVSKPAPLGAGAPSRPAVLLASARGKRTAWSIIESLALRGAIVLALDARGLGETRPTAVTKGGDWNQWFGDYDSAMTSVMLGTNLVSQRAHDVQRAFYLLAARNGVDRRRIYGAAQGNAAPPLLHAAAAGVPFSGLLLDGMVASYQSVVESPLHRGIFESVVPGAIRHYDLPGLISLMNPKPVLVVDPASPLGDALPPSAAMAAFKSASNVRVTTRLIEESPAAAYSRLLD